MSVKLTILGCGNSEGTPSIGNNWGECDPTEMRNRRYRPSVVVSSASTTLMIDTGPDFKQQVNQYDVGHINAVLYTHAHGDHINGIDELRVLAKERQASINVYGLDKTLDDLKQRFDYHFIQKSDIYPAVLTPHVIERLGQKMTIGDITFTPFLQDHGTCNSLGFRFGDAAYSTDFRYLPDESLKTLDGIKTWIVDGAGGRHPRNPVHLSIEGAIELNKTVGAKAVYLTHLTRYMDYKTLLAELPDGFEPAYDGLEITIP